MAGHQKSSCNNKQSTIPTESPAHLSNRCLTVFVYPFEANGFCPKAHPIAETFSNYLEITLIPHISKHYSKLARYHTRHPFLAPNSHPQIRGIYL